jgi:hypothetical protein
VTGPRSLRDLPSVDRLLADERLAGVPHEVAVAAARVVLDRAREEIRGGGQPAPLADAVLE